MNINVPKKYVYSPKLSKNNTSIFDINNRDSYNNTTVKDMQKFIVDETKTLSWVFYGTFIGNNLCDNYISHCGVDNCLKSNISLVNFDMICVVKFTQYDTKAKC